jgi:hypothetical protein
MAVARRVLPPVLVLGSLVWAGSWAMAAGASGRAMVSRDPSGGVLTDDDGGSPMFVVTEARPGNSVRRCIGVSFDGGSRASIRLYGTTTGDRMARLVRLTVVRGTMPGTTRFPSCLGFEPNQTDFSGLGSGVLFRGTVAAYPDTAGHGIHDPHDGWTSGESHVYEFVLRVDGVDDAQDRMLGQDFLWTARGP